MTLRQRIGDFFRVTILRQAPYVTIGTRCQFVQIMDKDKEHDRICVSYIFQRDGQGRRRVAFHVPSNPHGITAQNRHYYARCVIPWLEHVIDDDRLGLDQHTGPAKPAPRPKRTKPKLRLVQ